MKAFSHITFACMTTCMSMIAAASQASAQLPSQPAWSAPEAVQAIDDAMQRHLFDPAQTHSPAYVRTMEKVGQLAAANTQRESFVSDFNHTWRDGPFSHVRLSVARGSAAETANHFDQMRVGGKGALLSWEGDVAILTVNTMMGLDTIEQIDAAYAEIAAHGSRALIVDLRANEGGAFAVRPLVSHALDKPLDAGMFIGAAWFARGQAIPDIKGIRATPAWQGWSLKAFWSDVESQGILRIRFEPAKPTYVGPIYILTSRKTASAAELAADALQASGRAVVIGETTAGQMLSQKMYDVPGGLQISLPIADYRSHHGGRIEGKGVQPDIAVPADQAMTHALEVATTSGS